MLRCAKKSDFFSLSHFGTPYYPYLPPGDPLEEPTGGEVQEVPVDAALGRGPQGAQGQLPPRPALRPGGAAGGRG